MASRFDEICKQVFDDAYELLRTTALVEPLIQQDYLERVHADQREIAIFLRMQLARQVVLLSTKLHEEASLGRTGETASVSSLLGECLECGTLSAHDVCEQRTRLDQIKKTMEGHGLKFIDLRHFRNAEIAHSLHALKVILPNPMYWVIGQFAHETIELCFDLERRFKSAGISLPLDLESKFDTWRDNGENFWTKLSPPDASGAS